MAAAYKPSQPSGQPGPLGRLLVRIPLQLRIAMYALCCLAGVLAGLPWLAYRLDVCWPAGHVEIGAFRIVGAVVLAGFLGLYLYCSSHLTRRGKGAYIEFDPPSCFVADGPYCRVRNPVAGCVVAMLLAEAIALSSTGVFALFLLAIPLAHMQVVLLEEPLLHKRFGDAYREYCRRVPRWIPRLVR